MVQLILLALLTVLSLGAGASIAAAERQRLPVACEHDRGLAAIGMSEIAGRPRSPRAGTAEDKCAAYRQQFLTLVRARAVVAGCKSGPEREASIVRLDGTIEELNGAIAETCASE